jgi:hypothetical protein
MGPGRELEYMRRWLAVFIAVCGVAAAPTLASDVALFLKQYAACHPQGIPPTELIATSRANVALR